MNGKTLTWSDNPAARTRKRLALLVAVVALIAATVGLPGTAAHASAQPHSSGVTLTIPVVAPFTGVDAALGPIYETACLAATQQINADGGVLGHQINCKTVDTRGDPADAVPAVGQMYATTKNIAFVIGCTSDEASTVVPVFGSNKTVSFCMTGESEFDAVKFPYFFRLVPPDAADAVAMVAIAKNKGYKKIALAFGNDAGSQTFVAPAEAAIAKAGNMTIVSNQTLDINATTFQSEAQAIVAAKPQAIMMEALGAAGVALLSEVYQLNGKKMIPIIGTSAMIDPTFFAGITKAVGLQNFIKNFDADNQVSTGNTPAYPLFSKLVMAQAGKVKGIGNVATLLQAPGMVHLYDAINIAALAMVMSGSTSGSVYKNDILTITAGAPGATVVSSYTAGVAALKAHKKIQYLGVGGTYHFDAFHTSFGAFEDMHYTAAGTTVNAGTLNAALLNSLKAF
ncbi:MAG: ABC transporter substrate-binding protein [Acidimicrobiaceae bacterium]|nr:ABC transporter substrate-binding protein [Acidimicrobiaceae bacterium]